MHLDELKIWNFRKFGISKPILDSSNKLREPDLHLKFNKGLNLLVGENDSGKSAIIDAIKLICKTHSNDWIKIEEEDFVDAKDGRLRIECIFRGFELAEAKNFTEWLGREESNGRDLPFLRLHLDAQMIDGRILSADVKAGPDDTGTAIDAVAKELLQVTYLKALRDAKSELAPRRNSRLSKILSGHKAFKGKEDTHHIKTLIKGFEDEVRKYFKNDGSSIPDNEGRQLKSVLDNLLVAFYPANSGIEASFSFTGSNMKNILESLKLSLGEINSGLGSDNLLFIATELLLLVRDPWSGLRLGLIEELEAHLHPQAQMRVVEFLMKEANANSYQLILTSHSPNLASKVELENLIICTSDGKAFSMGPGNTLLDDDNDDYKFLKRFLDVTKSNLFFARGVILVEGYAEAILIPVIAKKIGVDLTQSGVSVVNVGSASFLRFAKIFLRKNGNQMSIKVSIITDLDLRPKEYSDATSIGEMKKKRMKDGFSESEIVEMTDRRSFKGENMSTFFSPLWTLEYCLAMSNTLRRSFYKAVLLAWQEKKRSQGIRSLNSVENKIRNMDQEFNHWRDSDVEIAFEIYMKTILNKQLSKAAIAQYFAQIIEDDEIIIDKDDPMIRYLIQAIEFASS